MVKHCFISNCLTTAGQEVCFFSVPEGKLKEWQQILAHKPGLGESSRLCHRHFREEDIKKGYTILGKFHPNKRWRLKKDVLPSLHLGDGNERGVLKPKQNGLRNGNSAFKKQGNKTPTVKAVLNKIVVEDQQIFPKRKTLHDASKINKKATGFQQVYNISGNLKGLVLTPAQPQSLQQQVSTSNSDVHEAIAMPTNTNTSSLQEASSMTLFASPSNVPSLQLHDSQINQENQLDRISEIVTSNDQIQTNQIDNMFQLEIATIHSLSGQQQRQSPTANVTQGNVAMPGISNVPDIFALNLNEEDAILTSPVNEHDYCKGTQHPKSKQTLSQIVLLAPLIKIPLSEPFLNRLKNECELPAGWAWVTDLEKMTAACSIFIDKAENMSIKTVKVVNENEISFLLNGKRIQPPSLPLQIRNINELKAAIFGFDKLVICVGIVGDKTLVATANQCKSVQTSNDEIRAKGCFGVSRKEMCTICNKLLHYLKFRMKNEKPRNFTKMRALERCKRRLTNENQKAVNLIKQLQKEKQDLALKAKRESLENYLSNLPLTARTVIRMIIQKTSLSEKDVHGKTMRWDSQYAAQCAMLRGKSCAAYRYIKENGLLPLPSAETLRKIVSSSECDSGLNELGAGTS